MGPVSGLYERAASRWSELQSAICAALEAVDGSARFSTDRWERPGGGGGVSRVLEDGAVFEKAGVNWSDVEGELPEDFAAQLPGSGRSFRATGMSLVLHPRSPMVPTTHANFRFLEKGDAAWFGGGADLTPYYLWREDAEHFHRTLAAACDVQRGNRLRRRVAGQLHGHFQVKFLTQHRPDREHPDLGARPNPAARPRRDRPRRDTHHRWLGVGEDLR